MSTAEIAPPASRAEWQATEGFLYVGEAAIRLMDRIQQYPPGIITKTKLDADGRDQRILAADYPANASLYFTVKHLTDAIPDLSDEPPAVQSRYGITDRDIRLVETQSVYRHGIGELNFPWQFAAGTASQLGFHFVNEGYLEQDQMNAFTLTDWANIIGTGWFSRLMHTMAYTRNGIYKSYGSSPEHYRTASLWDKIAPEIRDVAGPNDMFRSEEKADPDDGYTYVTASLTPGMTRSLRAKLTEINDRDPNWTGGCPVARYGTMVPRAMLDTNPHIASLIDSGHMTVSRASNDGESVRLQMPWSPIDISMAVLAQKLEEYDRLYGTPRLEYPRKNYAAGWITHVMRPAQDVLRRSTVSEA